MPSRIRSLLFGAVAASVLVLSACGSSSQAAGPTATPAPTFTPTPSASDIITKAKAATPKAATYTADIATTVGTTQTTIHSQVSYIVNPYEFDDAITTTDAGKTSSIETIATTAASYVKAGGKWIKGPANTSTPISSLDVGQLTLQAVTNPTLVGTESVNGISAYHFKTQVTDPTSGAAGSADIWIRADNYYFLKETSQDTGKDPTTGKSATSTVNVLYTAWDDQVKITIPTV